MSRFRWIRLFLIGAAVPLLASAQTTQTTRTDADQANPAALRISLDDAIRSTVERNLGVQLQSYNVQMSGESWRGAYGIFDILGRADVQTSSSESPITTSFSSSQSERTVGNVGIQQLIPTGGVYTLGFGSSQSTIQNRFALLDTSYNSGLTFSYDQPLLRNFGTDITRRGINIARNNLGISREAFRNELSLSVLESEQAYLDLVFARQNLDVLRQSLDLARDQQRITQIRIDVGAAAPLDILEPRVAIAEREESVIIGEAQVRRAEDRLRQLMNLPPEEWNKPIIPSDPVEISPVEPNADEAVARAFERRPELVQARIGTETLQILNLYARNQMLPQLDFKVEYGLTGLGPRIVYDPVTGEPIGTEGGYSESLSTMPDFPSWTVGLNVGVPIRNVTARAEERRSRLELDRSRSDEERIRQAIAIEVRQTIRDIETSSRQIVAARASRDAAEQNVDAERKRFENGMSTNFDVLRVQQALADGRSRELSAMVSHSKAVASYHRAVGDLLEVRNIATEEPYAADARDSRIENLRWLSYGNYANRGAERK